MKTCARVVKGFAAKLAATVVLHLKKKTKQEEQSSILACKTHANQSVVVFEFYLSEF